MSLSRLTNPSDPVDLDGPSPAAPMVYGNSAMTGLRLLPKDWYEKNNVTCWLNTLVDEIDREEQQVTLGTGEKLPYSRLILAMGARSSVPPLEGLERRGVFVLRTADDAIDIRGYAKRHRCRRAAVVGGGPLGLEAAFALHKLGLRVTVVQRSKQLLFGQLDARAGELLERYFLGLGSGIVLGATPVAVDDEGAEPSLCWRTAPGSTSISLRSAPASSRMSSSPSQPASTSSDGQV
jgi:NAD(P)H-nitrite reductase large subunit